MLAPKIYGVIQVKGQDGFFYLVTPSPMDRPTADRLSRSLPTSIVCLYSSVDRILLELNRSLETIYSNNARDPYAAVASKLSDDYKTPGSREYLNLPESFSASPSEQAKAYGVYPFAPSLERAAMVIRNEIKTLVQNQYEDKPGLRIEVFIGHENYEVEVSVENSTEDK